MEMSIIIYIWILSLGNIIPNNSISCLKNTHNEKYNHSTLFIIYVIGFLLVREAYNLSRIL